MRRILLVMVLMIGAWGVACDEGDPDQLAITATSTPVSGLPIVTFSAANAIVTLNVEVADTPNLTTCGLMHRDSLPDNQGMIFVFQTDTNGGFWMKNTRIPLSIAYVSAAGRIVDILEMQPGAGQTNLPVYTPRATYRFAIEANAKWFERNGIAIGDQVHVQDAVAHGSAGQDPPICEQLGY